MPPIRIVLADDHKIVRVGIRAMLEGLGGIEIVGEAAIGRVALALFEQHQPHLLLTDISMSEMNGLEATARVVKEFPNVRAIILSMRSSEEFVWQALRAGGQMKRESVWQFVRLCSERPTAKTSKRGFIERPIPALTHRVMSEASSTLSRRPRLNGASDRSAFHGGIKLMETTCSISSPRFFTSA